MMQPIYKLENIGKSFDNGSLEIFSGLNFDVASGESLAIVGASGSGKSTLLHIMGALDKSTTGNVLFQGRDLALMTADEQAAFRNQSLGFVFQFHHLLPEFSALENVALPGLIAGKKMADMLPKAKNLLERVGIARRMDARPATLSGGERQRAAIARALIMNPVAVLADEPTGNLDEQTGEQVGKLLFELNHELGMTLVVVTHNLELAARMDRRLELRGGELHEKA